MASQADTGRSLADYDRVAPSYESRERRRLLAAAEAEAARTGTPTPTRPPA